jgi:hypothetical protein
MHSGRFHCREAAPAEAAEPEKKLAVIRIPPNSGQTVRRRRSGWDIFVISLGIVLFLLLMTHVIKNYHSDPTGIRGPLSSVCTLYASPSGNDSNSGTNLFAPKTLSGAASATAPGSVVCLLAGAYYLSSSFEPPHSGSPSSWIVYRNYDSTAVNFVWTGAADASPMFYIHGASFPSSPAYLEFRGLNLDGKGNAADGFFCRGSHHLRFIGNSISNTGGSGIASINCDYLTADRNLVYHNGDMPSSTAVPDDYGWTSGISFNSSQWFDSYSGFHNLISNNIIAGEYDGSSHHSDGNGIILDLSNGTYEYSSADTPPALIINNLVYGNGGRCIEAFTVTNFWIVNNTCYKNDLDLSMGAAGSITTSNARDGYIINNISVAWRPTSPSYDQQNNNANIHYYRNMYYGSPNNLRDSDPSQFIETDPLFLNAPYFDAKSEKLYERSPAPSVLGDALTLQAGSPALRKGMDPSMLPNLAGTIVTDLKKYIYTDIIENRRAPGGPFDLGAYQSRRLP